MGNERKNKEGLPLQPGITVIGERKGMYKGEPVVFTIYYGNLVLPMIDGEFKHLSLEKYEKMLHDFLYKSEEGGKYAVATEEENRKAIEIVLEKEPEMVKDMCPQKEEKLEERTEGNIEPKEIHIAPSYEAMIQEIEKQKAGELKEENGEIYINKKQKEDSELEQQKPKENITNNKLEMKVHVQTIIIAVQFVLICLLCILSLKG